MLVSCFCYLRVSYFLCLTNWTLIYIYLCHPLDLIRYTHIVESFNSLCQSDLAVLYLWAVFKCFQNFFRSMNGTRTMSVSSVQWSMERQIKSPLSCRRKEPVPPSLTVRGSLREYWTLRLLSFLFDLDIDCSNCDIRSVYRLFLRCAYEIVCMRLFILHLRERFVFFCIHFSGCLFSSRNYYLTPTQTNLVRHSSYQHFVS